MFSHRFHTLSPNFHKTIIRFSHKYIILYIVDEIEDTSQCSKCYQLGGNWKIFVKEVIWKKIENLDRLSHQGSTLPIQPNLGSVVNNKSQVWKKISRFIKYSIVS